MRSLKLLAALGCALVAAPALGAQGYFGQNQVQYDKFEWRVLETEHFLIHYYPEIEVAAHDGARMAERAYGRLSRVLGHQFREKKPIILFATRGDFGQNNVTGDLGEFTGGVTEGGRHRILMPFTGDYLSFDRVLTHEMVHEFQYDIFARGRAGQGLQTMAQVQPPLWLMEGMAQYLSVGPDQPSTNTMMRDAALNGRIPSIEEMSYRPDRYNPYVYGEALWSYIGERWGDDVIGRIMQALPNVGVERAFRREIGLTLEELGEEWKESLQTVHLAEVSGLDRVRRFAQPLLTDRRTDGQIFLAPSLSHDGRYIAFFSHGSIARGQVFIDLWLGDGRTGKRIRRLVKSTTDPDFEELRLLYSRPSFSPDGKYLAFTAQRQGRDVLYLLDVERRRTIRRFDLPIKAVTSPEWAPDSRRLVFSGNNGGITDLYIVDVDGRNLRRLTNDRYAVLQPSWSPDGRHIVYVSDQSEDSDLDVLRLSPWRIMSYDLETGRTQLIPGQEGHNLNPTWAPDGQSIIYVSDRSGIQNLFLYDVASGEHFQLSNVIGGVMAGTEYSPAISWSRGTDRLAFSYFEDGEYTVWSVDDPRSLRRAPVEPRGPDAPIVAEAPADTATPVTPGPVLAGADTATPVSPGVVLAAADTAEIEPGGRLRRSFYRGAGEQFRRSEDLPGIGETTGPGTISVSAILDSAAMALPDTGSFATRRYRVRFEPDYVARPTVGYVHDTRGNGFLGGTAIVMSDMLGNHRLAFAGEVSGRFSDARVFAGYTNLGGRFQYTAGAFTQPYYYVAGERVTPPPQGQPYSTYEIQLARLAIRQAFAVGSYPFDRFRRAELGARFTHIDQSVYELFALFDPVTGATSQFMLAGTHHAKGIGYVQPYVALVRDNALFGSVGPIAGKRTRLQIGTTLGSLRWMEYLADYRRYDPIIFNYLTLATRAYANVAVGRDEETFPSYIGRSDFVRGYDRSSYFYQQQCTGFEADGSRCSAVELLGSRALVANAELRFPLIRRLELGLLPIGLPPLEGLLFYDVGMAWSRGQEVSMTRPEDYDFRSQRYPLRSYGAGLRLNLFGYAILRWDYAKPLDRPDSKWRWTFSAGPNF